MHQVLSPKQLAQAIGVSESSLKRWADDGLIRVTRTAGGHRRIPLAEALRFVRESDQAIVDPDVLGLGELKAVGRDSASDDAERLFRYLEEGNATAARGLIMKLYVDGRPVHEICDGPVHDAMQRLGHPGEHRSEEIFREHRATELVKQALHQLQGLIDVDEDAPVAVGGAPSGDPYALPSLAAAVSLRAVGVRTVNLGPDTPLESLEHACRETSARMVWLAVSAPLPEPAAFATRVVKLAEVLAGRSASVVVGGRMADALNLPSRRNLLVGGSMGELVAFGRGLVLARS